MVIIATYTFNSDIDTLPTFNDGFGEIINESYSVTSSRERIDIGVIDNITGIYLAGSSQNHLDSGPAEVTSEYSKYRIGTQASVYIYNNGESSYIIDNGEPIADSGYEITITKISVNYTDIDNGDGTITRTIVENELPTSISFKDKTGLVSLSYLDTSNVTNMYRMFYGCTNLTSLDLSNFDTSKVTNMNRMFSNCNKLTSLDLSNFNTSNVTDMYNMFSYCKALTTIDISNFDTSNVTDMSAMFFSCSNLTYVDMDNSDVDSINDIITELPTLSSDSYGTIKSGTVLASTCDIETASSKYWNIDDDVVAIYTFNSDTDTLPTFNDGYTYEYIDADNGDGTITRTIFSDSLPTSISFKNKTGLVSLSYLDTSNVTSMSYMFYSCSSLSSIEGLGYLDTSNVTDMSYMFYGCNKLTSLDLSNFNTSKVTNMYHMFYNCKSLTSLNLSNFDTSKVTTTGCMFYDCNKLTSLDLSSFNTSNVTNMGAMFYGCNNLTSIDLSNFNTGKVTNMYNMFCNCKSLTSLNLSNFDTSKVNDHYLSDIFYQCSNLVSVDMDNSDIGSINKIIAKLPTRTADSYGTLIASSLDNSIDKTTANSKYWNIYAKIAIYTFNSSTDTLPTFNDGLTYAYTDVNNGNDTTTRTIASDNLPSSISFRYKSLVSLSYLDTSNVTSMYEMFYGCSKLTSIDLSSFNTSNVTSMNSMFYDCTKLTSLDLSSFNTSNVTDMDSMFFNCSSLTTLDLSSFNTSKVTTMRCMFQDCTNLTSIDLSSFYTSRVTNISCMFYNCTSLASLDLSSFNTSGVNYMANVFYCCTNLTSIEGLSSFDTSNVTNMSNMFYGCSNLISLDLSSFNTSNVTNMSSMFSSCSNLMSVNMKTSDIDSINDIITELPTRTADSMGVMKVLDSEGVDISQANTVYWNVEDCKITEIVFDKNINTNATVTLGVNYKVTYNEALTPQFIGNIVSIDNFVSVYENEDGYSWEISDFSNTDGVYTCERTNNYRLTIENDGSVYATILNVEKTYTFNTRVKSFLHRDTDNGDGTVNRVVFCDPKPEVIWYTENGIINVNYLLGDKFRSITSSSNSIVSLNLSGCNTSNVTSLAGAFRGDSLVSVNLSGWNVENVTTVHSIFRTIPNLESINISGWKFKNLKYIQCFVLDSPKVREVIMKDSDVTSINRVIGELKTRSASSPGVLKTGRVDELTVDYASANAKFWNVDDDSIAKYTGYSVLPTFNEDFVYEYTDNGNIRSIWSDTVPTSISFISCKELNSVIKLNTSGLTSMNEMFRWCSALKSVNFSKSDVSNVTDMGGMFYACNVLTSVTGMENWNTTNVTRLEQIFDGCPTLTELDLSSWDTSHVNTFWGAFRGCYNLHTLNISGWKINGTRDQMFNGCSNLVSIIAKDCLLNVVNTLLSDLPSRTYSSPGTITIGSITGDLSSNTKYWNIASDITYDKEIFKYTTNGNISCKFNSGLVYAVHDVVNSDRTVTRTCTSDTSPTKISFSSDTQITSIKIDNIDNTITSANNMFSYCTNLTSLDLTNWDTSNVTDMSVMFRRCANLSSLDLSSFDTSNVTNMSDMFYECSNLTSLDVSSFDTSKVTDMRWMFNYCTNLSSLDLSNFDTKSVDTMGYMFRRCTNLSSLDLSNWKFGANVSNMFDYCENLINVKMTGSNKYSINAIITALPTRTADSMGTIKTGIIDSESVDYTTANSKYWNIVDAIIAKYIFNSSIDTIPTFDSDFGNSPTCKIYGKHNTYIETLIPIDDIDKVRVYSFNIDITDNFIWSDGSSYPLLVYSDGVCNIYLQQNTDTGLCEFYIYDTFDRFETGEEIADYYITFDGSFTITDTDNGNGTTTRCIGSVVEDELPTSIRFESCEGLLSLERLNISNLTTFRKLFYECVNLQNVKGISCYNTVDIIDMSYLFYHCESLTSLDVSKWDTSKVTKMNDMFYQCTNLTSLDLSSFNTSEVIDMYNMFQGCTNLTTLDLSSFDTSKVTDMESMFRDCNSLTSLDVSKWDTSKVTGMYNMFQGCTNLTSLDLSNWNTSEVTDMDGMFRNCNSLTSLDVSNFDTSKVTDMESMFRDCNSLTLLDLSNFNTSEVTDMSNMFKGCTNLSSLVLNGLDISKVSDMNDMLSDACNIEKIRMKNTDVACVNKIISLLETAIDKGTIYINNRANELPSIDKATATNKNYRICYRGALNIRDVDKTLNVGGKKIKSITSGPAYL